MTAVVAERLRAGTRGWHDALEATRFATAMADGTLPLDRYVGQLTAYRVVLEALEGELSCAASPSVARVWSADLAKLPFLERDLRYFAESGIAPKPWAADETAAFAQEIRRTAASAPQDLLGFLYVLEGSTLGALVLRPYVTTAYRLRTADGVAYYGSGDRDRWARFTARMNQALTEPEAQDRVITAAQRAYHHIAAITEALSVGLPAPNP
ncbi:MULTISPECIES: biliverdin-producing heme oxygenase [Streptomyces]|uniref:Biliverdin-producing heme oxygenase n=1 Tax=Streptomyces dengpaensis TaxID=2049881 RepID=A0ABM6SNT8_9ACTN|nr:MULTISPECIES: biliverdin-producing heme oxygenase [Streptomyces]AVH55924.1 biliverdin-producing heme oxygenase [Streptomyces dengpaensis]PIB12176.1 biliverdin-producing heme oxygenase [Streptomyces sp. HG99]